MAITNLQQARQMFRYGGDTMGGPNDASGPSGNTGPAGGASSGGNYGGSTNPGQTYGGGSPVTGGKPPSAFTDLTKDVLNPNIDTFTQSYQEPGLFGFGGGYRNLNVPGDTSKGFKQGIGSRILGGILGLINPVLGFGYRAIANSPDTFNKFKGSSTLEEFRDKMRGYGRTLPVFSTNPVIGGIETLGIEEMPTVNVDEEALKAYTDYMETTPDDPISFEEFIKVTGRN